MAQHNVFWPTSTCFSLQGGVCDFLTSERGSLMALGKENLLSSYLVHVLYKWGAKVLFTQTTPNPQLPWICSELRGSVLMGVSAAAEKAAPLVGVRGPPVRTGWVTHFPCWVSQPLSAGWCQWDYYDFNQPHHSGCSFPDSLNSREGLDWSCKDFHIHNTQTNTFFSPCPASFTNHESNPQST